MIKHKKEDTEKAIKRLYTEIAEIRLESMNLSHQISTLEDKQKELSNKFSDKNTQLNQMLIISLEA